MDLKNRFGAFLLLAGALSLFVFYASLFTPRQEYNFVALILGFVLVWFGWRWRFAKKPAPPPPPPPPAPAAPAPKKRGLLATIFKGPAKPAPPPPPPPPKKGLAALFSRKPKKK